MFRQIQTILVIFTISVLCTFCVTNPKMSKMETTKIPCKPGPEDIELEANSNFHRMIISWTKRRGKKRNRKGGIQYYDFETSEVKDFKIVGYGKKEIRPHGIYVVNHADSSELYAICHYEGDRILKFDIKEDILIYKEEWAYNNKSKFSKAKINDLTVSNDGHIYVTGPGIQLPWKTKGTIYLIKNKEVKPYQKRLYYPNGILVKDNHLYVTTTRGNHLYRYDLNEDGTLQLDSKKPLARIKGGDNITFHQDKLIIANHPKLLKFIFHAIFRTKSPSSIVSYDLKLKTSQLLDTLFEDNGKLFSGSSTGLKVGEDLYVAQVFGDSLLQVFNK